jgi:CheY-like chemotaxis protein
VSWQLLIVEDDDAINESLTDIFRARGYRVICAGNGQEAFERAAELGVRPDAILLDLLMPVMDGVEFLRKRTDEPLLATAPVIVMSAQLHMLTGSAAQTFAVIPKPSPLAHLLDAVHRACHGQPPPEPVEPA